MSRQLIFSRRLSRERERQGKGHAVRELSPSPAMAQGLF
jgi:hypothetical protein